MIITTSLRENEALIARAQELAHELGADYQPRRKLSLAKCLERFGAFYLLYKDRLSFVNIKTDCLLLMRMSVSCPFIQIQQFLGLRRHMMR